MRKKGLLNVAVSGLLLLSLTGCGASGVSAKDDSDLFTEKGFSKNLSAEEVIKYSSKNDKIGKLFVDEVLRLRFYVYLAHFA